MEDFLKKLNKIKTEAYSLISDVDREIKKTDIRIVLSYKEVEYALELMRSGFKSNYSTDWYFRDTPSIIEKFQDLLK